jgi:dsDNA-specific endonuclease/ATPase MutS2
MAKKKSSRSTKPRSKKVAIKKTAAKATAKTKSPEQKSVSRKSAKPKAGKPKAGKPKAATKKAGAPKKAAGKKLTSLASHKPASKSLDGPGSESNEFKVGDRVEVKKTGSRGTVFAVHTLIEVSLKPAGIKKMYPPDELRKI